MKRTIRISSVTGTEVEVPICEGCGREGDDTIRLINREELLDHLAEVEETFRTKLKRLADEDVTIPEPEYEKNVTETTNQPSNVPMAAVSTTTMTMTRTWPLRTNASGTTKTVERDYTGIDTGEQELIQKAEELDDRQDEIASVLRDLIRQIQQISQLPVANDTVELCAGCRELHFGGWDDE